MDSTIGLILQAVFRGRPDETSTSRLQNISLVEMIRTLNEVPAGLSVLARIQWLVFTMFNEGQYPASIIFNSMRATVLDYETERSKISVDVSGGRSNTQFGLAMELQQWKSCELASTLILLLAAPRRRESLLSALKCQSRALDRWTSHTLCDQNHTLGVVSVNLPQGKGSCSEGRQDDCIISDTHRCAYLRAGTTRAGRALFEFCPYVHHWNWTRCCHCLAGLGKAWILT